MLVLCLKLGFLCVCMKYSEYTCTHLIIMTLLHPVKLHRTWQAEKNHRGIALFTCGLICVRGFLGSKKAQSGY